ncbi:hypothetical protein K7432_004280 [Basidiobolus ranarum]|uniref:Rhodanese domain-containing protein n=1 Tax=Basidiobolus ranarum TaxID=34480 RepID=A0ABR2WYN1_9FUNG
MSEDIRVSVEKWLNSIGRDRVLDLRTREEFAEIHIKDSTCIPFGELKKRWFELPHRLSPFTAILPKDTEGVLYKLREWTISDTFTDSPEFWQVAKELDLTTEDEKTSTKLLFKPCPFLEEMIEEVETKLVKRKLAESDHVPTLSCCDVGCGSGRDVAWLCSRPNANWEAHAVDSWRGSLDRTRQLAISLNISEKITTCGAKFNSSGAVKPISSNNTEYTHQETEFLSNQFDLVICIRFLERSSFDILDSLVAPGGFLLYSTFVDGVIEFEKPFGENHRLVLGELKARFGESQGYNVLCDKIEYIEDGRPVNSFLAQKLIN